ncbi:hypothetical protein [Gordonia sihwensis]|uniref:hypothetical protein n=1 Tax=Gordonia sihwensis TaxID=173559 RepID=UPI003D987E5D
MREPWSIPAELSPRGREAAELIYNFLDEREMTYTGGCIPLRSPREHRDVFGEDYGNDSELLIIHDGGNHAPAFNYAYEDDETRAALAELLEGFGYHIEQCTSFYSAVYWR